MRATYLKLLATVFFWGTSFVAIKIAMQSFTPYSAAFLRFLMGATGLVVNSYKKNGGLPRLTREQWFWVIISAITGSILYNFFIFSGVSQLSTIRAALITAFTPAIITTGSVVIFKEKITPIKVVGVILSILGTIIVISRGNLTAIFSQTSWGYGELMIMGCVICWTTYTLIGKVALKKVPVLTLSTYAALVALFFFTIIALFDGIGQQLMAAKWQSIVAAFYVGFTATTLGLVWYFEAVQKLGASNASVIGNLSPVFAVTIAVLFLGETLTTMTVVGGLFVLLGVWLVNKK